jgi:hypothetical protein
MVAFEKHVADATMDSAAAQALLRGVVYNLNRLVRLDCAVWTFRQSNPASVADMDRDGDPDVLVGGYKADR